MKSVDRRSVLLAGLGTAAGSLGGCGDARPPGARAAAQAPPAGTERHVRFTAAAATVDLGGGVTAKTWAYDGRLPGAELRFTAGDTVVADLSNQLPGRTATSMHWHGLAVPNAMDGAPPMTQRAVQPGTGFTYRFTVPTPGTYFYHSHVGVQLDRALYGPLVVEDPREPLAYDDEWVVVLDDWLDGIDGTPDDKLAALLKGGGPAGRPGGGAGAGGGRPPGGPGQGGSGGPVTSALLGGGGGAVSYPYHLVNGRVPADPAVFTGTAGHRVRLRIVNAGAETPYRVALGGHRLTVTHTDGFPVRHQDGDAVLLGMGERYDVLVTLKDGVFPLVATAEGKRGAALAVVRTGAGTAPTASARPAELDGTVITADRLTAADDVQLPRAATDVTHEVHLTGGMNGFDWSVNGVRFDMDNPRAGALTVTKGQRVRLDFVNDTDMWHPMHLHGHTYQLGTTGPRKDTVTVLPHRTVTVNLDADNPGEWLLHCHNLYHGEAGMMVLLDYTA